MDNINELLGLGKTRLQKLINVLEVKHWDELHVSGQHAITTLIEAIDYIEDNYDKFTEYKSVENVVRDAVNNALSESGYDYNNYKN